MSAPGTEAPLLSTDEVLRATLAAWARWAGPRREDDQDDPRVRAVLEVAGALWRAGLATASLPGRPSPEGRALLEARVVAPQSPQTATAYRAAVEDRDALRIRVDALEAEIAALRPYAARLADDADLMLQRVDALCRRADFKTSAGEFSEPPRGGDSAKG